MPDKKLTDNEIVKALECCDGSFDRCGECPLDNINQDKLRCWELEKSALDLINRQKAEIKRLKSDVSVSRDAYLSMKDRYEYEKEKVEKAKQKCIDIGKALKTAKAEAYKECMARVEDRLSHRLDPELYPYIKDVLHNELEKMVGEHNA